MLGPQKINIKNKETAAVNGTSIYLDEGVAK